MWKLLTGAAAIATGAIMVAGARAEGPYTIAYASFGPSNTQVFIADGDGSNVPVIGLGLPELGRTQ